MSKMQELPSVKIWQIRSWSRKGKLMKTLKEVACGETVKVKKLTGVGAVKRRIMDMGITKGTDVLVRKVASQAEYVQKSDKTHEQPFLHKNNKLFLLL